MLIGLKESFIFLSTQKTASTAIEAALHPRAEIRLMESQFGKHMTIVEMMDRLGWLFNETDVGTFFIFGVIRDPVDFTLSLYNSHKGPGFVTMPHVYTGDMDFAAFLERWVPANYPQIIPQHHRFLDREGRIGANYVITYDRLREGLAYVRRRLGGARIPTLKKLNQTRGGITRRDLKPGELAWIQDHFKNDYRFMARHCDTALDSFSIRPDFL